MTDHQQVRHCDFT